MTGLACQGTACFAARHLDPRHWPHALDQHPRVYCLGGCYAAPAAFDGVGRPRVEVHSREAVVLERLAKGRANAIAVYEAFGGYQALQDVVTQTPEAIISSIERSGLRGRGGAGFPTGRKWRSVFAQSAAEKFVIANGDEGDAGAYIDRFLMEEDPHAVIEGAIIAGYAVGAARGYIYVRKEYPASQDALAAALAEAHTRHYLGQNIFGSKFNFEIVLVAGEGSYVCGEETALINSIEGRQPLVRARPPYPREFGLFGKPTLVNNIETLANVPWILRRGAETYAALGAAESRGTKAISLNSLFNRPGLYEVEFGITLRRIVEDVGGGLRGGKLKALMIGGPLAGLIPPELLDTPFTFEHLRKIGAEVGHGGIIAFDEHTSIRELIEHIFSFGAYESCGKCTACRAGTGLIEEMFASSSPGPSETEFRKIIEALRCTSLCAFGSGLAEFTQSVIRYFGKELETCFT